MRRPQQPLFLARDSYRRRRAMDAVRLLPFLGLFLVMLPLLWSDSVGPGRATAFEGLYLFAVWGLLILAAAVIARWLSGGLEGPGADGPAAGETVSGAAVAGRSGRPRPPPPSSEPEAR